MRRRSATPRFVPGPLAVWSVWLLLFLRFLLLLVWGNAPAPAPAPIPAVAAAQPLTVGCDASAPEAACARLRDAISHHPDRFAWTADPALADVRLGGAGLPNAVPAGAWTYALAAPFYTVDDEVAFFDLLAAWRGTAAGPFAAHPLLVDADTWRVLTALWGQPDPGVRVVDGSALLAEARQARGWAILPFHELQLGWKVLRIDGISPLEKGLALDGAAAYPLQVRLALGGDPLPGDLPLAGEAPEALANRHEQSMTVVAMTGVTALTRGTAHTMETRGLTYPARDIQDWLSSADLAHISNEVSFTPRCPVPPNLFTMTFCSHDRYIALLEAVGTDIVELTGNHLLDYGPEPLRHTLEMYRQRGWRWFGGGENLAEATSPLLVTHGPNRLAFLGCNPVGPAYDWATEDSPGSAPCDYERMKAQLQALRAEGYLPIVALQYLETYNYMPTRQQVADMRALAEAGAIVVQGSQAHQPQAMELYGDSFIHYGLGNLFFDQMQQLGTRQGFIDRLVFYEGRLLSVDLRTTLLEEYARPRSMTLQERRDFLQMIFALEDAFADSGH